MELKKSFFCTGLNIYLKLTNIYYGRAQGKSCTSMEPLIQHNGQTEADFFIVMTFHVEFDEAHRVCT